MGENASDIRETIKHNVEHLTDTVSAVGAQTATAVRSKVDGLSSALPDPSDVRGRVANPYALGLGLLAVGFVAGLLVPLSALERSRLQPIGDDIARRVVDARDELVDQSKAVVQETIAAAQDSAQKHGKEFAEHLGVANDA